MIGAGWWEGQHRPTIIDPITYLSSTLTPITDPAINVIEAGTVARHSTWFDRIGCCGCKCRSDWCLGTLSNRWTIGRIGKRGGSRQVWTSSVFDVWTLKEKHQLDAKHMTRRTVREQASKQVKTNIHEAQQCRICTWSIAKRLTTTTQQQHHILLQVPAPEGQKAQWKK
jgi:hypothetical protein